MRQLAKNLNMAKTNRRRRSIEFFEMWKDMPNTPENKEERAQLLDMYQEALKAEVIFAKLRIKRNRKKKEKKQESKIAVPNPGLPKEWLEIKKENQE